MKAAPEVKLVLNCDKIVLVAKTDVKAGPPMIIKREN